MPSGASTKGVPGHFMKDECRIPKLCPGSCMRTTQPEEALYQVSRAAHVHDGHDDRSRRERRRVDERLGDRLDERTHHLEASHPQAIALLPAPDVDRLAGDQIGVGVEDEAQLVVTAANDEVVVAGPV